MTSALLTGGSWTKEPLVQPMKRYCSIVPIENSINVPSLTVNWVWQVKKNS